MEAAALPAVALQPRRGALQPLRRPAAPVTQQTDLQRGVALDPLLLLLLLRSIAGGTRGQDGGVSPAEERVARSPARTACTAFPAGAQGVKEALLKRAPVGLYRLNSGVVSRTGAGRGVQAGGCRVVQNRSRVQHQSVGPGGRGGMRPASRHHYRRAASRGAGLLQGDEGAAAAVEGAAPRERCDGGEAPIVRRPTRCSGGICLLLLRRATAAAAEGHPISGDGVNAVRVAAAGEMVHVGVRRLRAPAPHTSGVPATPLVHQLAGPPWGRRPEAGAATHAAAWRRAAPPTAGVDGEGDEAQRDPARRRAPRRRAAC